MHGGPGVPPVGGFGGDTPKKGHEAWLRYDVNNALKMADMMQSYLQQQLNAEAPSGTSAELPRNEDLVEFKSCVSAWLELDSSIKAMKDGLRDRVASKKDMTTKILDFMTRYNIEDLNTAAGKLRYKVAVVKEPLSQQNIKDKVALYFDQTKGPEELNTRIFSERKTFTKPTLKRLAGPKQ